MSSRSIEEVATMNTAGGVGSVGLRRGSWTSRGVTSLRSVADGATMNTVGAVGNGERGSPGGSKRNMVFRELRLSPPRIRWTSYGEDMVLW